MACEDRGRREPVLPAPIVVIVDDKALPQGIETVQLVEGFDSPSSWFCLVGIPKRPGHPRPGQSPCQHGLRLTPTWEKYRPPRRCGPRRHQLPGLGVGGRCAGSESPGWGELSVYLLTSRISTYVVHRSYDNQLASRSEASKAQQLRKSTYKMQDAILEHYCLFFRTRWYFESMQRIINMAQANSRMEPAALQCTLGIQVD